MKIPLEQFEKWVAEAIDILPEKYLNRINNIVFLVADYPTDEQLKEVNLGRNNILFGLYEGYIQSSRRNVGAVTPDRITIFRRPICDYYDNDKDIQKQVFETIKHEIAHHFGSAEDGARKAGQRKIK